MSDVPEFKGKKIDDVDSATMRKELEAFFEHTLTHDPETLQFMVMLAGHKQDDGMHVCTMVGGSPPVIARAISELLDVLIAKDPTFAIFFLLQMLHKMKEMGAAKMININPADLAQFDKTGDASTAAAVEAFLKSMQGSSDDDTPPTGKPH